MARPRTHDEALRLKLLDRAGELIAADGPKALSLRKLAADAGTSTTAVYSLFGSKPDLVNALYTEGFRRFGARMAGTALTGDPVEDLVALGSAYRASALADPNLYGIMFTRSVPGFEPSPDGRLLAYSVDTTGSESFTLVLKDLETGELLPDTASHTSPSLAWRRSAGGSPRPTARPSPGPRSP